MIYFRQHDICFGTAKEACRAYNIHPATLLRWADQGKIRYKVGLGGRNRLYEIVPIVNEKPSEEQPIEAPECK